MTNNSKRIDAITNQFEQAFASLSNEHLNWKPNPDAWSIGQNIEHLITINETYYPVIEAVRTGKQDLPFYARFGFVVNMFGSMILKSVQPDRSKKIKTFPIWEPTSGNVPDGVIDRFSKHQAELKTMMKASSDLIEKGTVVSSPANRNIVYKLETAFEIMITHEERHFEQAMEVYKMQS